MTDTTTLIQRLSDEADLCRNDGATDVAKLLDDAVYALVNQAAQIEALRADAERMTTALNKIAERQNSDWPDRCQALVNIARAALRQEHVTAVVRSVCPNLAETSKAWRDLVVECRYWLEAAHGIGGK